MLEAVTMQATVDMAVLIKPTLQLDPALTSVGRAHGNGVMASQKLFQSCY